MCSVAVKDPGLKKVEVTFLLMLNRLVTQSCRMLVYGMRTLLKYENSAEKENTGTRSESLIEENKPEPVTQAL
jgi:hypothetical protein